MWVTPDQERAVKNSPRGKTEGRRKGNDPDFRAQQTAPKKKLLAVLEQTTEGHETAVQMPHAKATQIRRSTAS
jgi:hypothetical protein